MSDLPDHLQEPADLAPKVIDPGPPLVVQGVARSQGGNEILVARCAKCGHRFGIPRAGAKDAGHIMCHCGQYLRVVE